nr:hypothetical protein [Bacilli bacterium]
MKTKKTKLEIKNIIKNDLLNKTTVAAFIIGLSIGLLIMVLFMPDRIATLENGEEVIVSISDKNITANDLYNDMKEYYSVNVLLERIDKMLLEEKYPEDNDMKTEVNKMADYYISMAETYYGYSEDQFLESNEFKNRDEFIEALKLEYRRNKWFDEYAKSLITDKDINLYYENNVYGDIKTKYISVAGTDDNAKSLVERIINRLNNGETYEAIVDHYKDRITTKDLDYVSFDSDLDKSYLDALKKLNNNSYTKEAIQDSNGYKIIFKESSKDKDSLENIKDRIIKVLANEKKDNDSTLLYKALIDMRKDAKVEIKDTSLAKEYDKYIKMYTAKND